MEKIEIQASNIKCGGCVSNVESGLSGLQGVSKVSVDIPSNKVSVEGSALDRAVIEAKLAELGYPAS
ncbi:MAG: heavy metal-associated domain-containing protein [Thioalkalispiraceae bacterium]|jgi:copper chaperone CopZ